RHSPIGHAQRHFTAALAFEQKAHGRTSYLDVAIPKRGQTERMVLPRVLFIADAGKGRLEQADDRGHDLLPRQAFAAQVSYHAPPDARQHPREARHAVELVGVANQAPARVIAMLLAAARVAARRLQVTARPGRDPHVLPGRRNDQRADALETRLVSDAPAIRAEVLEALAFADALYAGLVVGRVDEPGFVRGISRRVFRSDQAALGGVIPGPRHSCPIPISRDRLRAHSRGISSSRGVSSLQGKPSCHRLAWTSMGSASSHG